MARCRRRKHEWIPKGVTNHDEYPKRGTTTVLKVCAICGFTETKQFEGTWSLDQMMRPEHLDPRLREKLITDLERMRKETS